MKAHIPWLPSFPDEDQTRTARLLYLLLTGTIVLILLDAVFLLAVAPETLPTFWLNGVALVSCGILLWIVRRGQVQLASILLYVSLWPLTAYYLATSGGLASPAIGFLGLFIALGTILFSTSSAIGLSLLNGVFLVGLYVAGSRGLLVVQEGPPTLSRLLVTNQVAMFLLAVCVIGSGRSMRQTMRRAREGERKLAERNQELEHEIQERRQIEAALRDNEQKYRLLVEQAAEGVVLVDEQGRIVEWNRTYERMTGMTSDQAMGQFVWDVQANFVPPERRTSERADHFRTMLVQALQTGQSPMFYHSVEAIFARPDGEQRYIQQTLFPIQTDQGHRLGFLAQDITERKQAEAALAQHTDALRALHKTALEIESELNPEGLLHRLVERAATLLHADRGGAIYLRDGDHPGMRLVSGTGINAGREGIIIQASEGVVGHVVRTSQPIIVNDYSHWDQHATILVHDPPSAVLGLPLFIQDQLIGVLAIIANSALKTFDTQDLSLAEMFASYASVAIHTARLFEQIQRELTERKQAEQERRESEERYRQLLERTPVPLAVLDLETLEVRYMNRTFSRDFPGFDPVDGFKIWQAQVIPGDRAQLQEQILGVRQATADAGLPRTEYASINADGTLRHTLVQGNLTEYDHRPACLIAVSDITKTKLALDAEAEQRRFTEALLDSAVALNSTLRFQEVLERIFANLSKIVPHARSNLMLIEDEYARIVALQGYDGSEVDATPPVRFLIRDTHTLKEMIKTREPLLIQDVAAFPGWKLVPGFANVRSYLGVPIVRGTDVTGFINLDWMTVQAFRAQDAERLKAFAGQIAIAIANAQLYEHAQEEAASHERQRLARELHDAVSQTLFSASVTAEALPLLMDSDPAFVRQGLAQLVKLTRGALSEMRTLLVELRPAALQEMELSLLLTHLINSLKTRTTAEVSYVVEREAFPIPTEPRIALYRMAQEALNNVVKHSRAYHCTISLIYDEDAVCLRVVDDGVGFEPESIDPAHMGIRIMRERAALLGIDFAVSSAIGQGTIVEAVWKDRQHE